MCYLCRTGRNSHSPLKEVVRVKTYVFHADLVQEEDGRWSAWVEALPGCATWGFSKEEALRNIRDAVEAYIRDMQEAGEEMPHDAATHELDEPVVAVTL